MNALTPTPAPLLLTIRQVAAALQLCEKSVWTLRHSGRLRAVCIGRAVRFELRDVLALVEAAKESCL